MFISNTNQFVASKNIKYPKRIELYIITQTVSNIYISMERIDR